MTVAAPVVKLPVVVIAPDPAPKLLTVVAPAVKVFVIAALPADKAPDVVIAPEVAFKLVTVVPPADKVLVILALPVTSRVCNGS